MTVNVSKPAFNVRAKLSELDKPVGVKGSDLMRSDTVQDARDSVSAGRKNLIINGSMKVSQRATSKDITGHGYHTVDRFHAVANSSMTYAVTMSQQSDNPDGLGKSVKLLTTTAKTPSGSENYILRYKGEEQDITAAGFGTSKSKPVTVSFSVKSNKTGIYGFQMYLGNFNPNMTVAYTINSKDTWERKTITLPPYTTSYTHNSDDSVGFTLDWNLSSGPDDILAPFAWQSAATSARGVTGQVNMLDTVNNYFQLTNVQLEIGENATEFETRPYAEELALCQRYYHIWLDADSNGSNQQAIPACVAYNTTSLIWGFCQHPVTMRTYPTLNKVEGSGYYNVFYNNTNADVDAMVLSRNSPHVSEVYFTGASITQGVSCWIRANHATAYIGFTAEL